MTALRKLMRIKAILKNLKLLTSLIASYSISLADPEKSGWGSIGEEEEEGIKQAVHYASFHKGPIVEIGALFGHTTNLLASLKQTSVPLIAVENFSWNPFHLPPNVHRRFTRRTLRYVMDHCSTQIFDGDAVDFYLAYATLQPSLIFIDASHDYKLMKKDIDWAISTGCPVISGHDYIDTYPGVIKAVDETFGDKFSLYGSIWIHQKG